MNVNEDQDHLSPLSKDQIDMSDFKSMLNGNKSHIPEASTNQEDDSQDKK